MSNKINKNKKLKMYKIMTFLCRCKIIFFNNKNFNNNNKINNTMLLSKFCKIIFKIKFINKIMHLNKYFILRNNKLISSKIITKIRF